MVLCGSPTAEVSRKVKKPSEAIKRALTLFNNANLEMAQLKCHVWLAKELSHDRYHLTRYNGIADGL